MSFLGDSLLVYCEESARSTSRRASWILPYDTYACARLAKMVRCVSIGVVEGVFSIAVVYNLTGRMNKMKQMDIE